MIRNILVTILLSVTFAALLLLQYNTAFTFLLVLVYLSVLTINTQMSILLYFVTYLFFTLFTENVYIEIHGRQLVNFVGISSFMFILLFCSKLRDFLQMEKKFWNKTLLYPVFLFALIIIFTTPFSKTIGVSLRVMNGMFAELSFYLFAYLMTVQNRYSHTKIFNFFTVVFILLSIYGVIEYFMEFNILQNASIETKVYEGYKVLGGFQRVRTVFEHPSKYAFTILIFMPLYIYYFVNYRKKMYFCMIGMLFINLILTFTRIAWIAFAIQIICSIFLFKSKKMFVISLLIIVVCAPFLGLIINRLEVIDSSPKIRIELFQFGLNLFKADPLYGCGFEAFRELSVNHFKHKIAAHGDYMRVFAEMGIFGGISYLILLFSNLTFAIRNLGKSNFAKVAFVTTIGFMIFSISDNGLGYSHVFWALLGIYNGLIVRDYSQKYNFRFELNQPLERRMSFHSLC